jgi:hypothetical protein
MHTSMNVLNFRHMIHAPTVSADKYLVRFDYKINGLTRYSYIPAHAGGYGGPKLTGGEERTHLMIRVKLPPFPTLQVFYSSELSHQASHAQRSREGCATAVEKIIKA